MLTDTDLAYAAAVIDTLALLRFRSIPSGNELPYVGISGPHRVVSWMSTITASKPTQVMRDYNRTNCSEHCPEAHEHIQSTTYRWSITGVKATIVLHNVRPFLRLQQELADELVAGGLEVGWKGQVPEQMRRLGWAIPALKHQPRMRKREASSVIVQQMRVG